ncbi:MAG: fluoride efflux transporter CrcB [Acidimicrobiales bacterium]
MTVVAIAVAAFGGAIARYLVDTAVQHRSAAVLPVGTLVVNVTGSLLLGFLVGLGLGLYHGLDDSPRTVLGTGFLGAYTTFSTFSYETIRLIEDGSTREVLLNPDHQPGPRHDRRIYRFGARRSLSSVLATSPSPRSRVELRDREVQLMMRSRIDSSPA